MNLVETFLVGLCFNNTCNLGEHPNFSISIDIGEFLFEKSLRFQILENALKGKHLKIATVQNGVLSSAVKENGTWIGKGVAFDLIELLQKKYNFTYSIILPKANTLGTNKTGIFGLLYNNEADLAASFLPMTTIYWQYAHFATSLDMGEWVVVLKRPQASASGSGIMSPFDLNVWLLILVSVLAVGPAMYLIVCLQASFDKNRKKSISLLDCIWFVYGALLKQGSMINAISDSTRIVFATWWIFITILTAFYTANLTAFLTLSEFTLPIKSAKDIGAKKYPWVTVSGSVIEEASYNRYEGLYSILRGSERMFVKDNGTNILRNWVTKRNYLYIAERPNVDILLYHDYLNKSLAKLPESKKCTYAVTPWSLFKRPRTFAYSKKFKYGPLFDKTLRNLVETGLVKYSLTKHLPNVKICPLNLGNKERQLRNTDLLLTYYIVGTGFVISALIFITEIVLYLYKKSKVNNDKQKVIKSKLNFGKFAPPPPPPPPYNLLFFHPFVGSPNARKETINGREYWVVLSRDGNKTLIPVRTPSALLFQYTD